MSKIDFETIKTIAAFSGAGIGILNLSYNLVKDFIPIYKIKITNAKLRCLNEGLFHYQIDFEIYSSNKDIYIQSIVASNSIDWFGPYNENPNDFEFGCIYENVNHDLLNDQIEEELNKYEKIKIIGYKIDKQRFCKLSLIGNITSVREMDGYSPIPLNNWKLKLIINNTIKMLDFSFSITDDSSTAEFIRN